VELQRLFKIDPDIQDSGIGCESRLRWTQIVDVATTERKLLE